MGAGIFLEFNNPDSIVAVKESFFEKNSADMGACIISNQLTGTLIAEKNIFIENIGITEYRVLIGSGSIIQSAGTSSTIINIINNLNIYNEVEYKGMLPNNDNLNNIFFIGAVVIYSAQLTDYNSTYIGN